MSQTRFMRKPEVRAMVAISLSTIRRMEKAGQFPKRVKLSKAAVGWLEADVLEWMRTRSSKAEEV